jgi:hypothetical protein
VLLGFLALPYRGFGDVFAANHQAMGAALSTQLRLLGRLVKRQSI